MRRIVAGFELPERRLLEVREPREPAYPAEELYGVIPADARKPYDVRELIARMVDGSELDEFKQNYGTTPVTGFAHLHGYPGGDPRQQRHPLLRVIAQGDPLHRARVPAAHSAPLLQNITGYMVGKKYEAGGIAKDGAKMVTAVATARVPKFTMIVGGSFGAGNYGMCGRAYSPRFLWMWPNARIIMGGEQAASVLATVKGDFASKDAEESFKNPIREQYERQGHLITPARASTTGWWTRRLAPPARSRNIGIAQRADRRHQIRCLPHVMSEHRAVVAWQRAGEFRHGSYSRCHVLRFDDIVVTETARKKRSGEHRGPGVERASVRRRARLATCCGFCTRPPERLDGRALCRRRGGRPRQDVDVAGHVETRGHVLRTSPEESEFLALHHRAHEVFHRELRENRRPGRAMLEVTRQDGVARVTLNRPELAMPRRRADRQAVAAFAELAVDRSVRVIVLAGNGPAFAPAPISTG